jgi:hypothetical protein
MKRNQETSTKREREIRITKILKNTLIPRLKTIGLKQKNGVIGNMKYLPSFSKE